MQAIIQKCIDYFKNKYEDIKSKSFTRNLLDLINFIIEYSYILVIIFVILMLITFLTYSKAPIAVLIRQNIAFYKTKPHDITVPLVANQGDI